MAGRSEAVVAAIYSAFANGDIPAALALMSPDMVWNEADDYPYADGNPYVGREAILQGVFARLASEWDGFGATISEMHDTGDAVVAIGRYFGTYRATGKVQDAQFAHVWYFEDGVPVRFQQFVNTLHVARVISTA